MSAPSVTDVEAALADVKLRAVPIAKRSARTRRMATAASVALAVGGAFWAGGLRGGHGITLGARTNYPQNGFRGAPELARDTGAPLAALVENAPQTWRITTWEELDGERFGKSEQYVTGPTGTSFGFRVSEDGSRAEVSGVVSADVRRDSVTLMLQSFTRRQIGTSDRGLDLFEEGIAAGYKKAARGGAVLIYPFGHRYSRRSADEPERIIRIEGPDVVAPAGLLWDTSEARASELYQPTNAWFGRFVAPFFRMARQVGVRVSYAPVSPLTLIPYYWPPKPHLRFSSARAGESVDYLGPVATRLQVPGTTSLYQVSASWAGGNLVGPGHLCVTMRPTNTSRGLRDDKWWGNCFRAEDNYAPLLIVTPRRETVKVELLDKPPLVRHGRSP